MDATTKGAGTGETAELIAEVARLQAIVEAETAARMAASGESYILARFGTHESTDAELALDLAQCALTDAIVAERGVR